MNASVMFFMAFFSFHSCSGGLTLTFKSEQASRSELQNVVTVKYERPANITCCPQWLPLSCWLELQHPLRGFNGSSPMQVSSKGDTRAAFLWCSHSGGRAWANLSRTSSWVSVGDPGGSGGATPFSTQELHWPLACSLPAGDRLCHLVHRRQTALSWRHF